MKGKLLSLSFAMSLLSGYQSFGQTTQEGNFSCGNHNIEIPDEVQRRAKEQSLSNLRISNTEKLYIPIMFHVHHKTDPTKITKEQIESAVRILNEDFQKKNNDTPTGVNSSFYALAANMNIEFVLARFDKDGEPVSVTDANGNTIEGVTYHTSNHYGGQGWENAPHMKMKDVTIKKFPQNMYLNVYITEYAEYENKDTNSGWAYRPKQVTGTDHAKYDGIVFNYHYLGDTGPENWTSNQTHMRRVMTHEVGHWLGLFHTFNDTGSCSYNDGIDDTPASPAAWTVNNGNCDSEGHPDCGFKFNVHNYMDYSNCPSMFTTGQVDFMRSVLSSDIIGRNNLISEDNLKNTLGYVPKDNNPRVFVQESTFFENSELNDGTVDPLEVEVQNASFADIDFKEDVDFTITGLPVGLKTNIERISESSVRIKLEGKAVNHQQGHKITGINVLFENSVFTDLTSDFPETLRELVDLSISFYDSFIIVYGDTKYGGDNDSKSSGVVDDNTNTFAKWFFSREMDSGPLSSNYGHGIWHNGSSFEIEAYGHSIIADNYKNVSLLNNGDVIGPNSNWVEGGDYQNLHHLVNDNYQDWVGKSGFAGFRFTIDENVHYGWAQFTVASDGKKVEIIDFAYHLKPDEPILAGDKGTGPMDQIITFDSIEGEFIGRGENYALSAIASSGLEIEYTSSDESIVKIVNGNELKFINGGDVTITANQSGKEGIWNEAEPVSHTINVLKPTGIQTISGLKIYPNPNQGLFKVEASTNIRKVIVVDVAGRIINEIISEGNSIDVDITGMYSGVYNVFVYTKDGFEVAKVIFE
ncbi:zinc-dependent metalloprotease [Aureibacter tunicatorum]|uniref:T9SS type A sorting domain-containing protein n=1 Tax=Aureibacter tunicatorum TaxID=866807 RepID=A0AAE3XP85_9BACT|nr:zinc-dependent metalloprotease [Aureibacter tunicatorum]MDR6238744.1 hypothetical protein [Aureibacter tunicatorum]BDD05325.1 hypothetical protein AUTU_28080 [Aureibacter tunicatorum]